MDRGNSSPVARTPTPLVRIFKDSVGWKLRIGVTDEWHCYLGWKGAIMFLNALYVAGEVQRILARQNSCRVM